MFRPNSSAITQANENYAHMSECNQKKNTVIISLENIITFSTGMGKKIIWNRSHSNLK
jgi:hypothetical protein